MNKSLIAKWQNFRGQIVDVHFSKKKNNAISKPTVYPHPNRDLFNQNYIKSDPKHGSDLSSNHTC